MSAPLPRPLTRPLTPGAYLKARRTAQLLSIDDVAAQLGTDPAMPAHDRAAWLARIEADISPAGPTTIDALRRIYRFDWRVLATLAAIARGVDHAAPRLCRICACSHYDPCLHLEAARGARLTCGWAAPDLCDACAGVTPAALVPGPVGAALQGAA